MNPCPPSPGENPGSRACPKDWPVISLAQNMPQVVKLTLRDDEGNPIQLNSVDEFNAGVDTTTGDDVEPLDPIDEHDETEDVTEVASARLWMKQHPTSLSLVEVEAEYQGEGVVQITFIPDNVAYPGMFVGDIQLLDEDDVLVFIRKVYIEIEQNTTDAVLSTQPITIADLRLAMRDCPGTNFLIEDFEFSVKELLSCIRKPVDYWNEALPPVSPFDYSNFPFRYHWELAAVACLLKIAAHAYRRNHLPYNAAGLSVDDANKFNQYQQVGDQMWDEYKQWVQMKKIQFNIEGGFGSVPGAYSF